MALTVDDIDDIKQLLVANNHVLLTEFTQMMDERFAEQNGKIDQKFKDELGPIKQTLDDLVDFVTEAIDTSNETHGTQLKDHEKRITKLEQKAA